MRDVLDELLGWWREGHTVGVGRMVRVPVRPPAGRGIHAGWSVG